MKPYQNNQVLTAESMNAMWALRGDPSPAPADLYWRQEAGEEPGWYEAGLNDEGFFSRKMAHDPLETSEIHQFRTARCLLKALPDEAKLHLQTVKSGLLKLNILSSNPPMGWLRQPLIDLLSWANSTEPPFDWPATGLPLSGREFARALDTATHWITDGTMPWGHARLTPQKLITECAARFEMLTDAATAANATFLAPWGWINVNRQSLMHTINAAGQDNGTHPLLATLR
jgi:hypothetical protein